MLVIIVVKGLISDSDFSPIAIAADQRLFANLAELLSYTREELDKDLSVGTTIREWKLLQAFHIWYEEQVSSGGDISAMIQFLDRNTLFEIAAKANKPRISIESEPVSDVTADVGTHPNLVTAPPGANVPAGITSRRASVVRARQSAGQATPASSTINLGLNTPSRRATVSFANPGTQGNTGATGIASSTSVPVVNPPSTAGAAGPAPSTTNPPYAPTSTYSAAAEFDKGGRRSVSDYPTLNNKEQFPKWQRQLVGTALDHKCENVLDHKYYANTVEQKQLFDRQQRFM